MMINNASKRYYKGFNLMSKKELKVLNYDEISAYFREKRKFEYENEIMLSGMKIRKIIHYPLLTVSKVVRRVERKQRVVILSDERIKTNKPVIFAATHIGGNDIEAAFEGIKEHAYLMLGDPGNIPLTIDGLFLDLNGVISLDTDNKLDKKISFERSLEVLSKGYNMLIFPEGAENILPNHPVMGLYEGAAKLSILTGADIIPLSIHDHNNTYYIRVGKNIVYENDSAKDITRTLKQALIDLTFSTWEHMPLGIRSEYQISNYAQMIIDKADRGDYQYTTSDIERNRFKEEDDMKTILENVWNPVKESELSGKRKGSNIEFAKSLVYHKKKRYYKK